MCHPHRFTFPQVLVVFLVLLLTVLLVISSSLLPVLSQDTLPTHRIIQSDDPLVVREGIWITQMAAGASAGSYLYTGQSPTIEGQPSDVLTLTFSGSYLEIVYISGPGLGALAIELDGSVQRTVFTEVDRTAFDQRAVLDYLSDGPHTLRVYAQAGGVIAVDAFILASDAAVTPTSPQLSPDTPGPEGGIHAAPCTYGGPMERVSVTSGGEQLTTQSRTPSISGDGRIVAFYSYANNLVSGDTNNLRDIFTIDRQTCVITRVSVATGGTQVLGDAYEPSMSEDGHYVVFTSTAAYSPNDTNGVADIYLHDRQSATTTLVSASSSGQAGNGLSQAAAISADGRFIAFQSRASDLVVGDTNTVEDVFVADRQTGQITRVSVATDGTQGTGASMQAAISADGRYVVFASTATQFTTSNTSNFQQIYLHDRQTGETQLVTNATTPNTAGNGNSSNPDISNSGRMIVYQSRATNLVAGVPANIEHIYTLDRQTGITRRITVGVRYEPSSHSFSPAISPDGQLVAFLSGATEFLPRGYGTGYVQVYVAQLATGQIGRVSNSYYGQNAYLNATGTPDFSADNSYVAFTSQANNMIEDDTNNVDDVYLGQTFVAFEPRNLQAMAASGTQINLTWQDFSMDETEYRIERWLPDRHVWVEIDIIGPNRTSYADTTVLPEHGYEYRVRAYRGDLYSYSPYSNEAEAFTFNAQNTPVPSHTDTHTPTVTPFISATPSHSPTPTPTASETPLPVCGSLQIVGAQVVGQDLQIQVQNNNFAPVYIRAVTLHWKKYNFVTMQLNRLQIYGRSAHWLGLEQGILEGYSGYSSTLNSSSLGWRNEPLSSREFVGGGAITTWTAHFVNGPSDLNQHYSLYDFSLTTLDFAGGCSVTLNLSNGVPTSTPLPGTVTILPFAACTDFRFDFVRFEPGGVVVFRILNSGNYPAWVGSFNLNWRVPAGLEGQMRLDELQMGTISYGDPSSFRIWDGDDTVPPTTYSTNGPPSQQEGTFLEWTMLNPNSPANPLYLFADFDGLGGPYVLDEYGITLADFAGSSLRIGGNCDPTILGVDPVPATPTATPTSTQTPTASSTSTASRTPSPSNTATWTFTPSATRTPTATRTNTPTATPRPSLAYDMLALFNSSTGQASLFSTSQDNPAPGDYWNFVPGTPVSGSWVMGDWNGDGQKTPGLYATNGVFYFSNSLAPTSSWNGVWFGLFGRPVVAGRFDATRTNDCVGIVDSANLPSYGLAFAMYFTCDMSGGNPPKSFQWLSVVLSDPQGFAGLGTHQIAAGDFNGDGVDSIAIRRGPFIAYTQVSPAPNTPGLPYSLSAFSEAQYIGAPSNNDYGYFLSGDWDNDGLDSFALFYQNGYFYRRNDLQWNSGQYILQRVGQPIGTPVTATSWRQR